MKNLYTYLKESYDLTLLSEGLLGKFLKKKGISQKDVKQIGVPTFKTLAELGIEIEKKFDIKVHLKFKDDDTKYIPIVINGLLNGEVIFIDSDQKDKAEDIMKYAKSIGKDKINSIEAYKEMTCKDFVKMQNDYFDDYWQAKEEEEEGRDDY